MIIPSLSERTLQARATALEKAVAVAFRLIDPIVASGLEHIKNPEDRKSILSAHMILRMTKDGAQESGE